MHRPESIPFSKEKLKSLQRLISQGEGLHLEFKRKASYPEKIVRELIAFANTEGGTLLVGVDDDGSMPGVKFPEEESVAIHQALAKHCRPSLPIEETVIPISEKRFILYWHVDASPKRPHFLVNGTRRHALIRHDDQSLKATREMFEIIKRRRKPRDIKFSVGEAEQKLFQYLAENQAISLQEFGRLAGLNRFLASRKVIRLVLANVLRITPTEKGDLYSRVA